MSEDYDPATYNPEMSGRNLQTNLGGGERPDGAHGTGFRFMPLVTVDKGPSPAIVCLAGAYPGLTADQLDAPQPLPFAPTGGWNYHMLTGNAAPGGFVAVPGSELLDHHPNTVGVVCQSKSLGLEFPDGGEHEVIAFIDRADEAVFDRSAFDEQSFYAIADQQGAVQLRWMEELPADSKVVGRLLYTQMPMVKRAGGGGGFAEMDDDFEF